MELLSVFTFEDIVSQYWRERSTGNVGLVLLPSALAGEVDQGKQYAVDSLVQLKLVRRRRVAGRRAAARHPEGWQALIRANREQTEAVAVIHTFVGTVPDRIDIRLPLNVSFEIEDTFMENAKLISLQDRVLSYRPEEAFTAIAIRFRLSS